MVKYFILEQATKVHKGSRSIVLLFLYLGARWGWVVNATPRPFYPRGWPCSHCIGGWVGPRAGLEGCGKSLPPEPTSPSPMMVSLSNNPLASTWTMLYIYICMHNYIELKQTLITLLTNWRNDERDSSVVSRQCFVVGLETVWKQQTSCKLKR
jgi:hypothetical protein